MALREPIFTWQVAEYNEKQRTTDWYWGLGIITVACVVLALIFGNVLFALLLILLSIFFVIRSIRKPHYITYQITHRGVVVETQIYPFTSIISFWVNESPRRPMLFLRLKSALVSKVNIPINGPDPDDIREFLLSRLFEEEMYETLGERLFDLFDL